MPTESIPFPTAPNASRPVDTQAEEGRFLRDDDAGFTPRADTPQPSAELTGSGSDWIGHVAQSAHQTIDRLAATAAPQVDRLHEGIAHAGDSLHLRADQARELGDEWAETLRCTVRENPLAALGVAVAVGVLIARISR